MHKYFPLIFHMMKQVKFLVLGHEVNVTDLTMELDSARWKQNCLYSFLQLFMQNLLSTCSAPLSEIQGLFPGTLENKKSPSHFLVTKRALYHQNSGSLSLSKFLSFACLHLSQAWRMQWEMQLMVRISSLSLPIFFLTCNCSCGSFQVDAWEAGRSKDGTSFTFYLVLDSSGLAN